MACEKELEQPASDALFLIEERESLWIAELLADEVASRLGPRDEQSFSILAADPQGEFIGGVNGVTHWRWLYVRHFFVAREWRRRGFGRKLMAQAEALAKSRDCVGLYLDTFEESAASFYESCGYVRCGAIENFPVGAARIYMRKDLRSSQETG